MVTQGAKRCRRRVCRIMKYSWERETLVRIRAVFCFHVMGLIDKAGSLDKYFQFLWNFEEKATILLENRPQQEFGGELGYTNRILTTSLGLR